MGIIKKLKSSIFYNLLKMKFITLFAAASTVTAVEKARPEVMDALKRLDELERMANDFKTQINAKNYKKGGNQQSGAKRNIVRKLENMHAFAKRMCQLQSAACRQEHGPFVPPGEDRIVESNPCQCVNGVPGGYRSFFNRMQDLAEHKRGKDQGHGKRKRVVALSRRIHDKLTDVYGCTFD